MALMKANKPAVAEHRHNIGELTGSGDQITYNAVAVRKVRHRTMIPASTFTIASMSFPQICLCEFHTANDETGTKSNPQCASADLKAGIGH